MILDMKHINWICFLLVCVLLVPCVTGQAAASLKWDGYVRSDGLGMPFAPADKYVSEQNPPDFTWPYVSGALCYDLVIYADENLTQIAYRADNLQNNFYQFPYAFETGITYYWTVRFRMAVGSSNWTASDWSEARRFRIDPDAVVYTPDDVDTMLSRVPSGHPRIWTRLENAEAFRAYKDNNEVSKRTYEAVVSKARTYVSAGTIPGEPTAGSAGSMTEGEYLQWLRTQAQKTINIAYQCGFAYLLTEEEAIGEFGIRALMELTTWDINGVTSYQNQDQIHREIAYQGAMAYDWLYDLMTAEERSAVLNMIRERAKVMEYLLTDKNKSIQANPYDSHGWTAYGYIGIIAVATYGEIPEADTWLRIILPAYAVVLPPWSYQDGGWSQGTDYWQYSTQSNQEFMDVLALAGIADLYQKAWSRNEYLYSLYAYPVGSYGSFGDQANRYQAETMHYSALTLSSQVNFGKNPTAKWLLQQMGGAKTQVKDSYELKSYYMNALGQTAAEAPKDYPLAHQFRDIGWVVMTNNLEDPNRVQCTFKSSPYGSFNHSHADQNSFIIQAFGENLAIKSGYYDSYHSAHDSGFTRKTFAHNTITMNGGVGQKDDSMVSNGSVLQFVNSLHFDSVTGEAANAYPGTGLSKFNRSLIYVRPDVFLVVDDLQSSNADGANFEWWLNAEHAIDYTQNTALIQEGEARLQAQVLYPQNVTAKYYDGFIAPDGKQYPAGGSYATRNEQRRVAFQTSKTTATKMVVGMQVYENGDTPKIIDTVYADHYLKLAFADGTTTLVNLGDNNERVQAGDITFSGAAVTYNDQSILLTDGSYLKVGKAELASADHNITLALGYGQLGLSVQDDTVLQLGVNATYLTAEEIADLKDGKGRAPSAAIGLTVTEQNGRYRIAAQKGSYALRSNGLVSIEQLSPQKVQIQADVSTGQASVSWEQHEGCTYDIRLDDEVITDCPMPYRFPVVQDKTYKIAVRAKYKGLCSSWSSEVTYSLAQRRFASHVQYTGSVETGIGAKAYVSNPGSTVLLRMIAYDANGRVLDIKTTSGSDTVVENYFDNLPAGTATVKTLVWTENTLQPLAPSAVYGTNTTDLQGIYVDGVQIDGFDNEKTSYMVPVSALSTLPVVSAIPADNATQVRVRYFVSSSAKPKRAEIELIAQNGDTRTVTVTLQNATTAKGYVTDLKVDIPSPPDGWDSIYTAENASETWKDLNINTNGTDTSGYKPAFFDNFTAGAKAYKDRSGEEKDGAVNGFIIKNVNPFLDIEGSLYIPPFLDLVNGGLKTCWYMPYYFGLDGYSGKDGSGNIYTLSAPALKNTPQNWYSFTLKKSAKITVATAGDKPRFIDDSWKELPVQNAFDVYNASGMWVAYNKIYEKYISVTPGESKTVQLQTPANGARNVNNLYYAFVKPIE